MVGIGNNLVEPRLTENESLTAAVIHRLYGTKIVWLLPTQDIRVSNIQYSCMDLTRLIF